MQITVGAVKTDSPPIPSPYRPYSPSIGVVREADTEAETDTEKEKECVYPLFGSFSQKKHQNRRSAGRSSHTGGTDYESSYEQGTRRDQH